jgi:hypothetical protein
MKAKARLALMRNRARTCLHENVKGLHLSKPEDDETNPVHWWCPHCNMHNFRGKEYSYEEWEDLNDKYPHDVKKWLL